MISIECNRDWKAIKAMAAISFGVPYHIISSSSFLSDFIAIGVLLQYILGDALCTIDIEEEVIE